MYHACTGSDPEIVPLGGMHQTLDAAGRDGLTHTAERCEPSVAAEGREACAALDLPLQRGVGCLVRAWYKHGACIMVQAWRVQDGTSTASV